MKEVEGNIINKMKVFLDLGNLGDWILKIILSMFIFTGAYLAPAATKGLAIMIFIFIDTFTGIWASKKERKPFRSSILRRVISKFIAYSLAMIVGLIFTQEFGLDILTVVAFGLATIEVTSIFENLYRITNINFLKWIMDTLNSHVDKVNNDGDDEK